MILLTVQILIVASLILSVYMIVVTLERCRSEKRYTFVYCIVALFLYNLGYFIEMSSGDIGGAITGVKIMYAGGNFMAPFFFFFVADYCEIRIPKKYYFIPLLLFPIFHYGVVFTFDYHELLYSSFWYAPMRALPGLEHVGGVLYMPGQLYPVFCVILSCIVLVRSIVRQSHGRRMGLILLMISALAPVSGHLVYQVVVQIFGASPLFTAFLMILSNFIFYYNVVRNDMFDLAPKAHAITMDLIRDAFVVLSWDMAYTGSNKKAQELFPALSKLHKGASVLSLEHWPLELTNETGKEDSHRQEVEFTLPHRSGRTYSGWTNRITSKSGTTLGWVILIQDITEMVGLIRNIQAQRDEIAVMRDNLKEGIFLMDRNFRIQDSYSRAMEDVLSCKNFRGRRFIDLLSESYNPRDMATIADFFNMIVDKAVSPEMLDEMNPLEEFSYTSTETGNHKTLRCRFAPIDQAGGEVFVMGTIHDISAEVILKKQLADEEERRQDEMRTIFEIMQMDQTVLRNFIDDADQEFYRAKEILKDRSIPNKQKFIKLYQSIHAIKSNALIVDLSSFGAKLHAFEEKIKIMREKLDSNSADVQQIAEELEKHIAGKEKLKETVQRLKDFSASVVVETRKDDEIFIATMKLACNRVANDENKKVSFVVETFNAEAFNRGPRQVIKDILTQLIRNAVRHGIEMPEDRQLLGKNETGKVTLSVTIKDAILRIRLWDDGRGLDFNKIEKHARVQGLLKNIPPEKIDRGFLSNIIFNPGFSTAETEDVNAGRGIGLNLVKDRLRDIKGKISIQSKTGQGMVFDMQIPLA